jgi:hypothetical protein
LGNSNATLSNPKIIELKKHNVLKFNFFGVAKYNFYKHRVALGVIEVAHPVLVGV